MTLSHYKVASASLIALIAFYMAVDIYTPSMPDIARYFGASENHIQWTMTLFMFGSLISTGLCGTLGERFGRRRVLQWGMIICALSSVMCYFANDPNFLIFARTIQGMGGATASVLGYSAIQDVYSEEESVKIFALMGTVFATVPAVAPVLGGFLTETYGWRSNFLAVIIFIFFAVMAIFKWFHVPETKRLNSSTAFAESACVFQNSTFIRYALPHSMIVAAEWFIITLMPFYFINVIGVSALDFGIIICFMIVFFGIGSWVAKFLIPRCGHENVMIYSLCSFIASGIIIGAAHYLSPKTIWIVSLGIGFSFFSQGFSFPSSISNSLKPFKRQRATASSMRGVVNAVAALIGTYIATILPDDTLMPSAIFLVCISVFGFLVFRHKKKASRV